MRLRRLILLDKKLLTVLYSHTFYVTESQCLNDPLYCEIPTNVDTLVKAFVEKYSVESEYKINFKAVRDSCDREDWFPVISINVDSNDIWPVVYLTTSKHIIIGIPLMKKSDTSRGFSERPEIPATLHLLDTFGNFLRELSSELSAEEPVFDIEDVLNFVAPYGILTNTSVANFKNALSGTAILETSSREHLQSNAKQAPTITVTLKETVRGIIYNRKRLQDTFDYTGSLYLVSTLPVKTDISATLLTTLDLTDVVPGPQLDKFHDTSKENRLQLFLTPGYDVTEVFKYTFEQVKPPIFATYKVTNGNPGLAFTLDLQFFLEQKISFDFIEVALPFPNRGPINSLKFEPQNSDVVMNKKKNQIIWRRAKPPVTDKLSLTGNLTFDSRHSRLDGHPQLRDLNSYADISFKSSSTTMSKMRLNRESVTVFPGNKFRLNYEVKSAGQSIRVWNSVGEVFDQ